MSYMVGTCSLCRGPVMMPSPWYGTPTPSQLAGSLPATPWCSRCGAEPSSPYGPVIEMQPKRVVDARNLESGD